MRNSVIAFDNLRAEMSRKNIGVVDMARSLEYNRDTLARKLSKRTAITLKEALIIQAAFFPEFTVKYLFSELVDEAVNAVDKGYSNTAKPKEG